MQKFFKTCVLAVLLSAGPCVAQSYDFSQGYIFEQPFVERIALHDASLLVQDAALFTPYLDWEWGAEAFSEDQVKRVGDQLHVNVANQQRWSLADFVTLEGDGEEQRFQYLRSTPDYHVVGVIFGHDQPAFLLISKTSAKVYFVDTHEE